VIQSPGNNGVVVTAAFPVITLGLVVSFFFWPDEFDIPGKSEWLSWL
jgi:hypothetical protein